MTSQHAFFFVGQGSQSLGMLSPWYTHPIFEKHLAIASDVLGYDMKALISDGPVEKLNQTEYTQPALLAVSCALWQVYVEQNGPAPEYMAGHSLGEYSALTAANVMRYEDALKTVQLRGQLMQSAVPAGQGAMAAILGLDESQIRTICHDAANDEVVEPVNFNAPGQIVIAGDKPAVERAMSLCKEAGAKRALLLPVSVPSHCALMQSAAEKLLQHLQSIELNAPTIPVIHNSDVLMHDTPEEIRQALYQQLFSPVRWIETVKFVESKGIKRGVECGPGKVLGGLNKRIAPGISMMTIETPENMTKAISAITAE